MIEGDTMTREQLLEFRRDARDAAASVMFEVMKANPNISGAYVDGLMEAIASVAVVAFGHAAASKALRDLAHIIDAESRPPEGTTLN